MLIRLYEDNTSERTVRSIVELLKQGGVIIYPTDTIYAFGCDMRNLKAIDRLCQIIGKKPEEANLTLICTDLSSISEYTLPFGNNIFKLMKNCLPGPYTFILRANSKVPKLFKNKKRTIGIRVPDNNIPRAIIQELGNPLITATIRNISLPEEFYTDAELIYEHFKDMVDAVVDGGPGGTQPSTIIDCSNDEPELVRAGKGPVDILP